MFRVRGFALGHFGASDSEDMSTPLNNASSQLGGLSLGYWDGIKYLIYYKRYIYIFNHGINATINMANYDFSYPRIVALKLLPNRSKGSSPLFAHRLSKNINPSTTQRYLFRFRPRTVVNYVYVGTLSAANLIQAFRQIFVASLQEHIMRCQVLYCHGRAEV
jgi:hypothetical protein